MKPFFKSLSSIKSQFTAYFLTIIFFFSLNFLLRLYVSTLLISSNLIISSLKTFLNKSATSTFNAKVIFSKVSNCIPLVLPFNNELMEFLEIPVCSCKSLIFKFFSSIISFNRKIIIKILLLNNINTYTCYY